MAAGDRHYDVQLSQSARDDLRSLGDYLSDHASPQIAVKVLRGLLDRIHGLSAYPERGAVPKEWRDLGLDDCRQLVVIPYRVIYSVDDDVVNILIVADGRRDFSELLQQRLMRR